MLSEFHFLRPVWLLALLPLALLLWQRMRADGDADIWRRVVDPHLLPGLLRGEASGSARLPQTLIAGGWLLLVVALAGPTWQRLPTAVYQAQQFRVIALDLSPSMHATDIKPSRLARARFELLDLLNATGDGQTAVIAYGNEPYIVSPLTGDAATIAAQVPLLDTGLLPQIGERRTDLALNQAADLLSQASAKDGEVILITDTVRPLDEARAAAQRLRDEGHRISVLAVGTASGAPVRLADGGLLKGPDGAIVVPKMDAEALASVAAAGGGRYVPAVFGDDDLKLLLNRRFALPADAAEKQDATTERWREEGPWLLLLLLPLAALAFRRGWLSPLPLLLVFVMPPPKAHAGVWEDLWWRKDQQAMQRLESGAAHQATAMFERPDWRAAAAYQSGDFARALESLDGIDDDRAAYNRGNSLARLGRLEEAVTAYDDALRIDPDDTDAQFNRDLVQRLLEAQRAQQQQERERQRDDEQEQQQTQDASNEPTEPSDSGEAEQQGEQGEPSEQDQAEGGESEAEQQPSSQQAEQADSGDPRPGTDQQGGESAEDASQAQAGEGNQSEQGSQSHADQTAAGERQDDDSEQQAAGQQPDGQQADPSQQPDDTGEQVQQQTADTAEQQTDQQQADAEQKRSAEDQQGGTQPEQEAHAVRSGEQGEGGQPSSSDTQDGGGQSGQEEASGRLVDGQEQTPPEADGEADRQGGDHAGEAGDPLAQRADEAARPADRPHSPSPTRRPGMQDLLNERQQQEMLAQHRDRPPSVAGDGDEDAQALEQMLRQVEDDPGGLLRQRFLLQHLQRQGRLPQ